MDLGKGSRAPSDSLPQDSLDLLAEHGVLLRSVEPLAGDVSLRRYYRVVTEDGHRAVLVRYPPELAGACGRFERTSTLLAGTGVRVPAIELSLCAEGLMLVEDLGPTTLYDLRRRGWDELVPYLREAVGFISAIQAVAAEDVESLSPPLDAELLGSELQKTWDLLTAGNGSLSAPLPPPLADALAELVDRLAESPQAPCHRDFMARNLIPVGDAPRLAVIDHQDLRIGPATYDLASLLNDSLYPPEHLETELVTALLHAPGQLLDYHRAAAQRTLKIVGTFVGFAERGDDRHRVLIRPTLERARRHLAALPEMASVETELKVLWDTLLTDERTA